MNMTFRISFVILAALCPRLLSAQEAKPEAAASAPEAIDEEQAREAERLRIASSTTVRRFHEVLDELLAEFGYDVKLGQINGLKNVAIRKVEVSDALPHAYESYIKLLVAERIRENSEVKIINCLPCTTKTSQLVEGKLLITSPATNIANLKTVADRLGIDNFMDVLLVYHTTHMVLAFQVFKVGTNEMIWARTYNSETIRSRFQKLAVDYSQVAKSRVTEEYKPEYRVLIGLGGAGLPNVGGTSNDSSMINLQVRSTEKFDNRNSEFGMLLSTYLTIASILKEYPLVEGTGTDTEESTSETKAADQTNPAEPKPFKLALGLYGLYSRNFIGSVESYAEVRQGINLGLGTILAPGYLAGSLRAGWDIFFGRRFALSFAGVYIAPSKILVQKEFIETKGGAGVDVVLSLNY